MQVLEQMIPWLGWNPRTLVWMLQAMAARHDTASPRSSPLNVGDAPFCWIIAWRPTTNRWSFDERGA